ncbi:IS4 family transposase, partial [Legionella pneumophila]|nr:IS4 family transposase [Legionella pneumophila]
MHAVRLLQTNIEKSCPNIHKKRSVCLFEVVGSLIDCGKLWISALGRSLKNHTTAKHNIKKVDTLVGNRKLHDERDCFYNYVATTLIGTKTRPIIIVDWSPVSADCKHYFLRASVTGIGRSMTIYEEVHLQKHYANNTIHTHFLRKLRSILPENCHPIVVIDAGFRNTWFRLITKLGWDFIGRVRFQTLIKIGDEDWVYVKCLYPKATTTPKYLNRATVARANPLNADLYIYKERSKGRIKKTLQGVKCQSGNSKKYAKGAKEPWIIITSLPKGLNTAKKIIKIYKLRMQIEGAFKDIKNKRYGFRLPESGTKSIERLEDLILIALLATVVAWLAGQVAISNKWHYQIQANTVRTIPVLSIMFIGLHILKHLT